MYASAAPPQTGRYPGLWHKGRHRVEINAEIAADAYDVDAALGRLGYQIVDADQWGRSYRHGDDPRRTAELDELEGPYSLVRLLLRRDDLTEAEIPQAEEQLALDYTRLYTLSAAGTAEGDERVFQPGTGIEQYGVNLGGGSRRSERSRRFDQHRR